MLISKERAEYLAKLSYECNKDTVSIDKIITYKKALELDKDTAENLITQYEKKLKTIKMKESISSYGGTLFAGGKEIIDIRNSRYVDSYEISSMDPSKSYGFAVVKLDDDAKFEVHVNSYSRIIIPNIYEHLFPIDNVGDSYISNIRQLDLYLKLLIAEDREINPYIFHTNISSFTNTVVLPMKEVILWKEQYSKEIDIINRLLDKCNGYIISQNRLSDINSIIGIKPTVLYLEDIGEDILANDIRKYQGRERFLDYVIKKTRDNFYGAIFDNSPSRTVSLL